MSDYEDLQYAHKAYASATSDLANRDAEEALDLLRCDRKGVVLDLGCGTGQFLYMLAKQFSDISLVGVDPNKECLRFARLHVPANVSLYDDIMLVGGASVDSCVILNALSQFQRPHETLALLWEKLKPGGQLVIVVHNANFTKAMWLHNKIVGYRGDWTIKNRFTKGSLLQLMRDAGFIVEKFGRFGDGWSNAIPLLTKRMYLVARRPQ